MKDIELELSTKQLKPNEEFTGTITVNYPGRYDGVVVNTQILDSNQLITYKQYNEKKISQNHSRLFIDSKVIQGKVEFTAVFAFTPDKDLEVKFRVSIIEQHKEIDSVIVFAELGQK